MITDIRRMIIKYKMIKNFLMKMIITMTKIFKNMIKIKIALEIMCNISNLFSH